MTTGYYCPHCGADISHGRAHEHAPACPTQRRGQGWERK